MRLIASPMGLVASSHLFTNLALAAVTYHQCYTSVTSVSSSGAVPTSSATYYDTVTIHERTTVTPTYTVSEAESTTTLHVTKTVSPKTMTIQPTSGFVPVLSSLPGTSRKKRDLTDDQAAAIAGRSSKHRAQEYPVNVLCLTVITFFHVETVTVTASSSTTVTTMPTGVATVTRTKRYTNPAIPTPSPVYAACTNTSSNIAGTFNGFGIGAFQQVGGPQASNANTAANSAYECCVSCQMNPFCAVSGFYNTCTILLTPNTTSCANQPVDVEIGFANELPPDGFFIMSNGLCGKVDSAGNDS